MAAPVVSWYDADNTTQISKWEVGTVDAGSVSNEFQFLVWNNRGGSQDVSDMENCRITVKDINGGNDGELVMEKWVEVKVDRLGEGDFTEIGGDTTHTIGNGTTEGVISGAANGGTAEATENNCLLSLRVNVPSTATAGEVDFLVRVQYNYV